MGSVKFFFQDLNVVVKRGRMRACRNTGLTKKIQKWILFDTYLFGQLFEMHGQNLIGYATLVTTTNYRF